MPCRKIFASELLFLHYFFMYFRWLFHLKTSVNYTIPGLIKHHATKICGEVEV
jgi:hypothetical protein